MSTVTPATCRLPQISDFARRSVQSELVGAAYTSLECALMEATRIERAHERTVGKFAKSMLDHAAAAAAHAHPSAVGTAFASIERTLMDTTSVERAYERAVGKIAKSMLDHTAYAVARVHPSAVGAAYAAMERAHSEAARVGRAHEHAVGAAAKSLLSQSAYAAARAHRSAARNVFVSSKIARSKTDRIVPQAISRDIASVVDPCPTVPIHVRDEKSGAPIPFRLKDGPGRSEETAVNAGTGSKIPALPSGECQLTLVVPSVKFKLPKVTAPVSDNGDRTGSFNSQHRELLLHLEHHLRNFVERELRRFGGSTWVRQRVSVKTRTKWEERKQKDNERRGDSYALIYYADLMDLADVVCRKDNWRDTFLPTFKNQDDFQASMRRLNSIRNAIAHGRPLVDADQIVLCSEAQRLLRALGFSH